MDIISATAGATIMWVGGMQVIEGVMTPGDLMAFSLCVVQLYDPIKKLNSANQEVQQGLAGAERVFDILDSPEIKEEEEGDTVFDGQLKELSFDYVSFTYPNASEPAVDGVNLTIKAASAWPSSAPADRARPPWSTCCPAFTTPPEGLFCSRAGRQGLHPGQPAHASRPGIAGYLPVQHPGHENIAYAQDKYDFEDVKKAAKAAYAHDFIMEMPNGYDTLVGEAGIKISGGQKQRLTIARAIMKNPSLLILDEATSALDTESERTVQKALDNLMQGRTSIVIAHRLSTVLSADVIVVMENGRIIAKGCHGELLESCPLYKRLYDMQFDDLPDRDE